MPKQIFNCIKYKNFETWKFYTVFTYPNALKTHSYFAKLCELLVCIMRHIFTFLLFIGICSAPFDDIQLALNWNIEIDKLRAQVVYDNLLFCQTGWGCQHKLSNTTYHWYFIVNFRWCYKEINFEFTYQKLCRKQIKILKF